MVSLILMIYALSATVLLFYIFQKRHCHRTTSGILRIGFLFAILLGIIYDNIIQALGPVGGEGLAYQWLNYLRFYLHATILPFLTIFILSIMHDANIALALRSWFCCACWVFTFGAVGYGYWYDLIALELVSKEILGHTKLIKILPRPPMATIATNTVMVLMAGLVWRVTGWRWLILGGLFIFCINGLTVLFPWGFLIGNFAELVFVIILIITHIHFSQGTTITEAKDIFPRR